MSIKVKLGDIFNAVESKSLAALANMSGLSAKSAYDVTKLVKKASAEYDAFKAARDMLIKNLGEKEGNGYAIKAENTEGMAAFVKEMGALAEREVEFKVSKVTLPAPKGDDPCGLTAANLLILDAFITIPGVTDAAEEAKDGDAKKPEEGANA